KRIKITNERTLLRFKTMERLASLMLEDVYTAFKKTDLDLLDEIIFRDQDIDAVFVQITTSDIFEESDAFLTGQIQLTANILNVSAITLKVLRNTFTIFTPATHMK